MHDVSLLRLYVLRALYLLVVVGLAIQVWPGIFDQSKSWEMMDGVVRCMLAAFSLICLLGLRYPLQMLPILLWEIVWKTMWLALVAYPAWSSGTMSEGIAANAFACIFVVLVIVCVPWDYAFDRYVRQPAARWR